MTDAAKSLLCLVEAGPPPTARCVALGGSYRQDLRRLFANAPQVAVRAKNSALLGVSDTVAILRGAPRSRKE